MSKSQEQTFSLNVEAIMEDGSTKVKADTKIKTNCNVLFMANVFKGIMEEEEHIKTAILLAVSSLVEENMDKEYMMDNLLSKVTAQA